MPSGSLKYPTLLGILLGQAMPVIGFLHAPSPDGFAEQLWRLSFSNRGIGTALTFGKRNRANCYLLPLIWF
jgi:hypothetical protein